MTHGVLASYVSPGASTGGLCQPSVSVHRGGAKGWSTNKDVLGTVRLVTQPPINMLDAFVCA